LTVGLAAMFDPPATTWIRTLYASTGVPPRAGTAVAVFDPSAVAVPGDAEPAPTPTTALFAPAVPVVLRTQNTGPPARLSTCAAASMRGPRPNVEMSPARVSISVGVFAVPADEQPTTATGSWDAARTPSPPSATESDASRMVMFRCLRAAGCRRRASRLN
jgi:hypothetical protein